MLSSKGFTPWLEAGLHTSFGIVRKQLSRERLQSSDEAPILLNSIRMEGQDGLLVVLVRDSGSIFGCAIGDAVPDGVAVTRLV